MSAPKKKSVRTNDWRDPRTTVDGTEWFHVPRKNFNLACCDCGLVHRVDTRVDEKGRVWQRMERDDRETARARNSAPKE